MKLTAKEKIKVRKMTLTDKKKIEKALELLDELVEYTNNQGANWREPWAKGVIEKIKEILEK